MCCSHSEKGSGVARRAMEGGLELGSLSWGGKEASRRGQEGEAGLRIRASRGSKAASLREDANGRMTQI